MTQPASSPAPNGKPQPKEENFFVFLIKLVLIVGIFRSFFFSPFNIPSESMLPRLVNGDYLLAAKWSYGFSRFSVPFDLPIMPRERIWASQPKRGDVVIFRAPGRTEQDWIKRTIGLPGDTVEMRQGVLYLNGQAVPKVRIEDFEIAVSDNTGCYRFGGGEASPFEVVKPNGVHVCRYPQFRETLPGENGQPGKSYNVLDFGLTPQDTTPPVKVPEGHLFLMGDDRDNSMDSRFSTFEGGIDLVPQDNLVGRATILMWSTDGGVVWYKPWTWLTSARWNRIGGTF
ncbi:signal peptidase I [Novosphingobium sp. FSY-8]|uniref:Signal peptidase I n=1 Tax=Novosphingobium ovatum TaxID=1908523 RepID=A0ABW9XB94_9SPHN|nr:signal peptidase I [Novosphingobium ovatum]NBC35788.1 signal peptidase I [Novosphingobium ovatum]